MTIGLGLALAASLAGVSLLFLSWRRRHGRKTLAVLGGWLVLGLSAALWTAHAGAEFGIAYGAIAVAIVAWTLIAATCDAPRNRGRRVLPYAPLGRPGPAAVADALGRTFVAIPLAGAASLLAAVAMVKPLSLGAADRYVLAITVSPLLWGGLSIWAAVTSRLVRTGAIFSLVAAVAAAILFAH